MVQEQLFLEFLLYKYILLIRRKKANLFKTPFFALYSGFSSISSSSSSATSKHKNIQNKLFKTNNTAIIHNNTKPATFGGAKTSFYNLFLRVN